MIDSRRLAVYRVLRTRWGFSVPEALRWLRAGVDHDSRVFAQAYHRFTRNGLKQRTRAVRLNAADARDLEQIASEHGLKLRELLARLARYAVSSNGQPKAKAFDPTQLYIDEEKAAAPSGDEEEIYFDAVVRHTDVAAETIEFQAHGRRITVDAGRVLPFLCQAGEIGKLTVKRAAGKRPYLKYWYEYAEPRLRRLVDRDEGGMAAWTLDGQPERLILAPHGCVPGVEGAFVTDESVEVSVRVPREFHELTKRYLLDNSDVFSALAADVAGLSSWRGMPRADGICTTTRPEVRALAKLWFEQAAHSSFGIHQIREP